MKFSLKNAQIKESSPSLNDNKKEIVSGAILPERFTSTTVYIKEYSGNHSFNSSSVSNLNINKLIKSAS